MLVLTMRGTFDHEGGDSRVRIQVGDVAVWVTLIRSDRGKARVGFEAPEGVSIKRQELLPPDQQYGRARRLGDL